MLLAKKERVLDYACFEGYCQFIWLCGLPRKARSCLSVATFEGRAGGWTGIIPAVDRGQGKGMVALMGLSARK